MADREDRSVVYFGWASSPDPSDAHNTPKDLHTLKETFHQARSFQSLDTVLLATRIRETRLEAKKQGGHRVEQTSIVFQDARASARAATTTSK